MSQTTTTSARSPQARRKRRHTLFVWAYYIAVVVLSVSATVAWMRQAHCSPLDCEGMQDPDGRNFCRALTKHDPSYCEFIKDANRRMECRAVVKR